MPPSKALSDITKSSCSTCLKLSVPFNAKTNDEIWINVYHWEKVLQRPVYDDEDAEPIMEQVKKSLDMFKRFKKYN
jgi:hypothetical protein